MKRIYLDCAATTPTDPAVLEVMRPYFGENFGNPSSIHSFGMEAKEAVENARKIVADALGASPEEIVFTSGGTESDNLAIKGVAYTNRNRGNHIITSAIEHHAVLESCKFLETDGFDVTYLAVDQYGLVNPNDLERAITKKTILVSIMHANNEIGTIQPIAELAKIAKAKKAYFHTDAVQTFGHIPTNVDDLGVDLFSISAHKLYGPKGVGALYIRKGTKIETIAHGGDQEGRLRAGTLNVPGIVGLGKAVELSQKGMKNEEERERKLQSKLIDGLLKVREVRLNGHPKARLSGNVNVSVEGVEGESMVLNLDMLGISCSTGSACTSSSLEPSHVLLACGLSAEIAHGSLRFSLGTPTSEEDIDYLLSVFPKVVGKLRKMSPMWQEKGNYAAV
jgi:cysteine desulfurase